MASWFISYFPRKKDSGQGVFSLLHISPTVSFSWPVLMVSRFSTVISRAPGIHIQSLAFREIVQCFPVDIYKPFFHCHANGGRGEGFAYGVNQPFI